MSQNKNVVLVMGLPNTGKSHSLKNLNQPEWAYLNADLKEIPFQSQFAANIEVSDAKEILGFIDEIENAPNLRGGVIDTLSFLMQMYERQYVTNAIDTRAAWGTYSNFYRDLIHRIKAGSKDYAILAHAHTEFLESKGTLNTVVPVKGAIARVGIEADFTTILSTKQMTVESLKKHSNALLHITDAEKEDGLKYVFCTRVTKDTIGEKMRSPDGLWGRDELYIDNNLEQVFARIKAYSSGAKHV